MKQGHLGQNNRNTVRIHVKYNILKDYVFDCNESNNLISVVEPPTSHSA